MTRIVEAIYEDGVLKPVEALDLQEHSHVRATVESISARDQSPNDTPELVQTEEEREALLAELFEEIDRANLHLGWRIPAREELYDRL
jgi:predicted DNA-binding antitoxin AbrB/MazE fold protein